jgi:hypothetical protein
VPGLTWTVRQLYGHLASSLERYAKTLARHRAGAAQAVRPDTDERNATEVVTIGSETIGSITDRLDAGLRLVVAAAEGLDDVQLGATLVGDTAAIDALAGWSQHFAIHGLDFLDALPELRFDPMMLNWLLYVDYSADPQREARQLQLLADLRARYADEDDDDGD